MSQAHDILHTYVPGDEKTVLHLHRSERSDRLVAALAEILSHSPGDPFAPEVVAVHSRGIERWLAQQLSQRLGTAPGGHDGVCANVQFPFPARLVGRALAAATDVDPDADPWLPERLVWPLLDIVDEHLDEPWLATLAGHLDGAGDGRRRRFGAVRHIADLFDRYGVHRPGLVLDWAGGGGVGRWQATLWRRVRDRVAVPSPAERLDEAVQALRDGAPVADLPERFSLFGLTALPASYVRVLAALAEAREVHLFLLHPSPALWSDIHDLLATPGQTSDTDDVGWPPKRTADPTRSAPSNPLLASWGRDAREMQVVLERLSGPHDDDHLPAREDAGDDLLSRIRSDVRDDVLPPGAPLAGDDERPLLLADDGSLQVHACHGRTRQVEVLRDAILHLLESNADLEPRDVIVMCPDIEEYAPLVEAVFGSHAVVADAHDADGAPTLIAERLPDVRVRLADRALRRTNPVLRVVAELLDLADGRLTAPEVLELASREPVRRRFRFDDADLERFESWVAGARIRWGLDASHRERFGLGDVSANTWREGLRRLLLGVTMADEDERLVGGVVPLDDVEGGDVDLAGRVTEFVERLATALDSLAEPRPVAAWRDAIGLAADMLTTTREPERWQAVQLHRVLDDVVAEATLGDEPSAVPLELAEIRVLLDDRLRGRPSRANHRTGDLTVCTLVPMRSVPHRVVCLLGMDDGAFPRRTSPDGDDLLGEEPRVGDRDARTEDRQLLLDALLAAGEHLVITYTGRDERTNEPQPPSVPVGELLDVVDRTVRTADGRPAREHVVIEHPLQPFDPRNFQPGALVAGRPWGFDPTALAGAREKASGEARDVHFLERALEPPDDVGTIALEDLVAFLQHPVKAFLRQRLGVSLPGAGDETDDAIPVELGGLEEWSVGDRLLAARLAGTDPDAWARAERARGTLPPGAMAAPLLERVEDVVEALLAAADAHADVTTERDSLEVVLPLTDGRALVGTVPDVAGDVLLALRYSRVDAKHRLASWVHLLAATATHPERALEAVTVGRRRYAAGKSSGEVSVAVLPPLGDDTATRAAEAREHLLRLVDLYDRGLREPLPLYCRASESFASAEHDGEDGVAAAEKEWTTTYAPFPKEDLDDAHGLVLGGQVAFDDVVAAGPRDGEQGEGWPDEPSRFGRYARLLWDPILERESLYEPGAQDTEGAA